MKKRVAWFVKFACLFSLVACASSHQENDIIVGEINQQQLMTFTAFSSNFDNYLLTAEQIKKVSAWPKDLEIDVYFGTWCHDSQREVPRLLKLLENNSDIKLALISLDYEKTEPSGLSRQANVKYTPTIIVKRAQHELGRIVESPKVSIVDDISAMIK